MRMNESNFLAFIFIVAVIIYFVCGIILATEYVNATHRDISSLEKNEVSDCTTVTRYVCANEECNAIEFSSTKACYEGEKVVSTVGTESYMEVPTGYYLENIYEIKTCVGEKCCTITESQKDGNVIAKASSMGCLDRNK